MLRAVSVVAAALAVSAAGCGSCDPVVDEVPAGSGVCGTGPVDGTDYKIDSGELVLKVARADAFGCGALHSHVVEAKQATFSWDLDSAAAGEVDIVVAAASLDPDDPTLRTKYLPDGENQALSDGDRTSIRGSVLEEVQAETHPALTFKLKDLTTLNGEGTATLTSTIAGADSDSAVAYTATKDGDVVTLHGTATIEGAPHGIPRNALGFCVDPAMGLEFTITLAPGTVACDDDVEEVPPYVQQEFPDEECGDVGFNVVYNHVIGPRCAGCHGATMPDDPTLYRGGATVPLFAWEHFRVDSFRNQGTPLFEKAHEYVNLDPAEGLAMPPPTGESTPLQQILPVVSIAGVDYATEKDLFNAWIAVGEGRNTQCADDVETKTFGLNDGARVEPGDACGGLLFDTPQDEHEGESAATFFNACLSCHTSGDPSRAPSAPAVATMIDLDTFDVAIDFAAGALPVTHPFYIDKNGAPLSFWEASVFRTEDGSMSPGIGVFEQEGRLAHNYEGPAFDAFKAWVAAGYCGVSD